MIAYDLMSVVAEFVACVPLLEKVPSPLGVRGFFIPIHGPLDSKANRQSFLKPLIQVDCSLMAIVLLVPSITEAKLMPLLPGGKTPPPEQ